VPVGRIRRNPRQPRRAIDAEGIDELASSIAAVGLVQPVIVRETDEGYELIAGERRWLAAQKAGFTFVPAVVRQASDAESLELALVENVVRQQLNPVDEAYALRVLLEDLGVTQENLAARVGKSRSAIANKMRLLDLPAPVQDLLADGRLSEGHGRALLGLSERGAQLKLARRVVKKGLSVRQVEDEVRRVSGGSHQAETTSTDTPASVTVEHEIVNDITDALFGLLGVTPRLKKKGEGGVIEVPFGDADELRRMADRLGLWGSAPLDQIEMPDLRWEVHPEDDLEGNSAG
jgi:ParB family transcriptional regulator, chromosome partitioning protein